MPVWEGVVTTGNSVWGPSSVPPDPSPLPFHTSVHCPFLPPFHLATLSSRMFLSILCGGVASREDIFSLKQEQVSPITYVDQQLLPLASADLLLTGVIPSFHEIVAVWHISHILKQWRNREIDPDWGRSSVSVTSVEERRQFCLVVEQDIGPGVLAFERERHQGLCLLRNYDGGDLDLNVVGTSSMFWKK